MHIAVYICLVCVGSFRTSEKASLMNRIFLTATWSANTSLETWAGAVTDFMVVISILPGNQALEFPCVVLEFFGTNFKNHCPQVKSSQLCKKRTKDNLCIALRGT